MALRGAAMSVSRASRMTFKVQQVTPKSSFSSTGFAMPKLPQPSNNTKFLLKLAGGAGAAGLGVSFLIQPFFGSAEDFYDYRFITTKDPDDLAGFYGSEDFMELFCVLPFMGTLMMRGGVFDDEGTVHTAGLPGEMLVSMEFSDEDDEETGSTLWFNKRENFKDVFMGHTMWDMTQNFGFHTLPDGQIEVYHHGVYFHGHAPPFSLIVRLVFQIHAMWLIYATEHHINLYAFTSETEEEEAMEHRSRSNMPFHLLFDHLIPDMVYKLTGIDMKPSFVKHAEEEAAAEKLIRKASAVGFKAESEDEEEEEDESEDEDEEEEEEEETVAVPLMANGEVPVTADPEIVRLKAELAAAKAEIEAAKAEVTSARANIARRATANLESKIDLLVERKIQEKVEAAIAAKALKRAATRRPTGAWSTIASTNDSTSYEMATQAAIQRHQTLKLEKKLTSLAEVQNVRRSQSKSSEYQSPSAKAEFERIMKEKEQEQKQRDVVAAAIKATFDKEDKDVKITP